MDNKICKFKHKCACKHCDDLYCLRKARLLKLFTNSNLATQFFGQTEIKRSDIDLSKFTELSNIGKNITENVKAGINIYIYSKTIGNGKSTWSIRFLQDYIYDNWYKTNKDCIGLFINVPYYLLQLKNNISNKNAYIENINKYIYDCDLLIFDDIATKVATEFEHEHLLSIIDYRINNCKANIYTSNADPTILNKQLGNRLYSRIYEVSKPNIFKFEGKDRRGELCAKIKTN